MAARHGPWTLSQSSSSWSGVMTCPDFVRITAWRAGGGSSVTARCRASRKVATSSPAGPIGVREVDFLALRHIGQQRRRFEIRFGQHARLRSVVCRRINGTPGPTFRRSDHQQIRRRELLLLRERHDGDGRAMARTVGIVEQRFLGGVVDEIIVLVAAHACRW